MRSKIPYKYAIALTAALGLFMAVLDNTIVNVALTAMRQSFHTDINTIQWVITAYFLTQAAVIPVAGYLSLRFGTKRMFLIALGLFSAGSFLCGISPHLTSSGGDRLLIAFRVVQGLGGGMLFPLATSIAFGAFPPEERASSSALVALPVLLAPTLGPTIGGLIVDSPAGWPWMFFINVPVGLVAMVLFARIYQPARGVEGRPVAAGAVRAGFDYLGLMLSTLGTVLVVYAFTLVSQSRPGTVNAQHPNGDIYGLGYWGVWALLGAGIAALAVFTLYELRVAKDPVLDLRLFANPAFAVANVLTWVVRAVVFGSFFLLPLFLQQFRGMSATNAGLALIPQGLAAAVAIVTGGRFLYDRLGPRLLIIIGLLMLTLSSWMLSAITISTTTSAWDLAPTLFIRGLGFGWSNLILQTVALSLVTGRALPKASSLYNATAQVFSSIGVALITTVFIQQTTSHGEDLARAATAAGVRPPTDLALRAATHATTDVFLYVAIATAITVLIGLLLPARSIRGEQEAAAPRGQGAQAHGRPAAAILAE